MEILPRDSPLSLCLLSEACLPAFFNISLTPSLFPSLSLSPSSASLFQSAPLSCSLVSICSLTSYLPSSRRSLPPPLSGLTASVKSFSIKPYETFMLFSTSSFTLTSRGSQRYRVNKKRSKRKDFLFNKFRSTWGPHVVQICLCVRPVRVFVCALVLTGYLHAGLCVSVCAVVLLC